MKTSFYLCLDKKQNPDQWKITNSQLDALFLIVLRARYQAEENHVKEHAILCRKHMTYVRQHFIEATLTHEKQ